MKTSTLRDAICIALFTAAACAATPVIAQEEVAAEVGAEPEATTGQQPREEPDPQEGGLDGQSPAPDASPDPESEVTELASMTVTGTRIRGGTTPSPVIEITSEQIREEGFTDLGEVIRSVPQNFGGGQNPGVVTATASGNISNQGGAGTSALNLRGIGPDATLTLLNGRRLAYDGFGQAVDISAIPVEAVDRIEIVADGASAIYGSDAVAGVGNVVLRRNFEGITLGTRHGASSSGGLDTSEYSATAGLLQERGGLLATYKNLSSGPIRVDQRKYTEHMDGPFVLYPSSNVKSGLISGYKSLGDHAELNLDAMRTTRETTWYQNISGTFYENRSDTTSAFVSPSLALLIVGGWSLQGAGTWAKSEALGDAWMVTPGAGDPIHIAASCWCNDNYSYELSGEGPIFETKAGQARLAIGMGYRVNKLLNESYLANRKLYGSETSKFAYTEMNLPLVSPDHNNRIANRVTITAAARIEKYESFGEVATPKVGLIYGPSPNFTVKTSWGRSFKAPTLSSRYGSKVVYLVSPSAIGGVGYGEEDAVLLSWGSNAGLRPERAKTVTASVAFHPEVFPGANVELSAFSIDYGERVVQPFAAFGQILNNEFVSDFIDWSPTKEKQDAVISEFSTNGFINQTGRPYDPDSVIAIGSGQFTNAMRQKIKGVDLLGSYRLDTKRGSVAVHASGSWLSSEQRNIPGQEAFDLAGTIFYPAKRNARLGAVWSSGGLTASLFSNYRSGVSHHVTGEQTASFTTFDSNFRYIIESGRRPFLETELALKVDNILNREPPLYLPTIETDVPYDSTNYSAIGRFISASISIRW